MVEVEVEVKDRRENMNEKDQNQEDFSFIELKKTLPYTASPPKYLEFGLGVGMRGQVHSVPLVNKSQD